jgi:hypothetical protein
LVLSITSSYPQASQYLRNAESGIMIITKEQLLFNIINK